MTSTSGSPHPSGLTLTPVDLHLVGQDVAERVIPPPADALDDEQRATLLAEEPLSLLHVLGPEGEGGAEAGGLAGARLRELIAAGRYRACGAIFALHELTTPQHCQVGLVAGIPMDDVQDGRVRPHEATRADRERQLADFLDAAGMDVSPVVLTHELIPRLEEVIAEVVQRPADLAFLGWHQVHHRVWIIDDAAEQRRIREAAAPIESLTIVDGHHRVAAPRAAVDRGSPGAPATLLAELISEPELRMIGYDRRIRVDDPADVETLLAKLPEVAEVERLPPGLPDRPTGETEMLVGSRRGWVRARFRDPPDEVPDRLPATMLQACVLAPYLGIEDPRSDPRLDFVAGLDDLTALDRCLTDERDLVFVPRPVRAEELLEVARVGATLPPKSTYVDPKPGPGVLVRVRRGAHEPPAWDP
jgi:uncharacterized protein (DUF1015 family)